MHTLAAESQSLHEHLLAYVKQNLPAAKFQASLIFLVMIALAVFPAACATQRQQAQNTSSQTQLDLEATGDKRSPPINLNTATSEELETLPGVGKVIAERIVAHRQQYGPFRRAEHIMMVRGISDRKFRAIKTLIRIE